MGKEYLIDSNIIIAYLDKKLSSTAMMMLNEIIDNIPNISVITKIEVLRFNTTESNYEVLKDFINESLVLGMDDSVVEQTINICKSRKIKLPDAIIAATALVHNFTLVTRNITDFKNIEGLELLNPWE